MQLLRSKGANLQVTTADGDTLLHIAASIGSEEAAAALIPLGVGLNIQNKYAGKSDSNSSRLTPVDSFARSSVMV